MENEIIYSDLLGQDIETNIEDARNGDTQASREILRWFCDAIESNTGKDGKPLRTPSGAGTQIDERILRYLAGCFKKILDDGPGARENANHALGLVAPGLPGNKKTRASREHTLDMGYQVMMRHKQIKAEARQRLHRTASPLHEAINDVAGKHNKSYQTVKDAYDEWNKTKKKAWAELQNMGK